MDLTPKNPDQTVILIGILSFIWLPCLNELRNIFLLPSGEVQATIAAVKELMRRQKGSE